jgi:5-methylcytosine-specific restriction endonuclease McrA
MQKAPPGVNLEMHAVRLSDKEGIADLEKKRLRTFMKAHKERVIAADMANWYDPDMPMGWAEKRARLWDISMGKCAYCQSVMNPFRDFSIDHDVPKSKGGDDSLENLVACCRTCNTQKHDRDGGEWLTILEQREQGR